MRVLIIYAIAGIGHKKAAEAIYNAFGSVKKSDDEILLVNALDHTNRLFGWLYPRAYLFLIRHFPTLWGFIYYILDNKAGVVLNRFGSKKLRDYIRNTLPDVVITTHFFPISAVSHLKRVHSRNTRLITVITDLYPHYFWISPEVDLYVAGADETKMKLIDRGVGPDRIDVSGIPIDEKFLTPLETNGQKLNSKMSLTGFTLLFAGGGFGIGPMERMVKEVMTQSKLHNVCQKIRIIVVCGNNKTLYDRVSALSKNSALSITALGFIDNMDEVMDESDLIITKPGGITIFEAIAKGLPIVAIYPIPGQEKENAKLLARYKVGVEINSMRLFREFIVKLIVRGIGQSSQYKIMKDRTRILARPDSAERIARLAYGKA